MFGRRRQAQATTGGDEVSRVTQYKMKQRMISLGDDFFIEDQRGRRVFHIDGKMLRLRDTLMFKDMQGNELCKIQERMLRVRDTMAIEGPGGNTIATVKKALITPLRERFTVDMAEGGDIDVTGNILDHEYRFERNGRRVAEVSKKWFRIRDTYGVEIEPGQNDVVILAATVALDEMTHEGR
ncbi:MAG: LURP-one-related family protein [Chloroflexi bacterium]|nr:LURP-one-related family protein [Chloroflexota bacterium]